MDGARGLLAALTQGGGGGRDDVRMGVSFRGGEAGEMLGWKAFAWFAALGKVIKIKGNEIGAWLFVKWR